MAALSGWETRAYAHNGHKPPPFQMTLHAQEGIMLFAEPSL